MLQANHRVVNCYTGKIEMQDFYKVYDLMEISFTSDECR